jgi:RNA polymerase-binding protein DksA
MTSLNNTELETLKGQLQAAYDRLIGEVQEELVQSGEQHYIDLAGRVTDMGEQSVADALADLDAAMIDRHVHEIREIEMALARITAGSYGDCADCGAAIGFARLKAYPTAVRCIDCQALHDKQFAHENRPSL